MKNNYELAVILHPDLEIDITKGMAKIEKVLADNKAEIEKTDNWGKRKLAYTIKKQDHGIYVFYTIKMPATNVAKLDSTLNITSEIIRHLIVKPGPQIKVTAQVTDETEKSNENNGKDADKEG